MISASAEPVVVFTDGTLTNLAAAFRLDPGIVENIAMVYTMGGAVDVPGNNFNNPDAEWNIWVDPTAAAEVFASGVPLTLVPLDATNQVPVHLFHLPALREHQTTPAATATVTMLEASEELRGGTLYFWDGITAALLVDQSLAQFETMRLSVVHEGGPEVVGTTERAADGSEVRVALTVDAERFVQQFFSGLAGEDIGPIAAPPQTPAATIEELLTAYYAGGGGAGGWDAFRALSTYECRHTFYSWTGRWARSQPTSPMPTTTSAPTRSGARGAGGAPCLRRRGGRPGPLHLPRSDGGSHRLRCDGGETRRGRRAHLRSRHLRRHAPVPTPRRPSSSLCWRPRRRRGTPTISTGCWPRGPKTPSSGTASAAATRPSRAPLCRR